MRFYTTEKIGAKRSRTKEGFLLIEEVPIGRTGVMVYRPEECGLPAGPDGLVHVIREESEAFNPRALESFNGKPVTIGHPPEEVTPANWKKYSVGTVLNTRRGTGDLQDYMVADFLITDDVGITALDPARSDALREVSCGYDADYKTFLADGGKVVPGRGFQTDILGNHVALVKSGRCGASCAVGDQATVPLDTQEAPVADSSGKPAVKTKGPISTIVDSIRKAFESRDAKALDAALGEMAGGEPALLTADEATVHEGAHHHHVPATVHGGTHHHHAMDAEHGERLTRMESEHKEMLSRLAKIEEHLHGKAPTGDSAPAAAAALAPTAAPAAPAAAPAPAAAAAKPATADAALTLDAETQATLVREAPAGVDLLQAKDSTTLQALFQDTLASAEILKPGIALPQFTRDAAPAVTVKEICALRRRSLDAAVSDIPDLRTFVEQTLGHPYDSTKLSCETIRNLFRSAAIVKRTMTNSRMVGDGRAPKTAVAAPAAKPKMSAADLNKMHEEFYAGQNASASQ